MLVGGRDGEGSAKLAALSMTKPPVTTKLEDELRFLWLSQAASPAQKNLNPTDF